MGRNKKLSTGKRKIASAIFEDGLELILPGDNVVIKDFDNLSSDEKARLGEIGVGVEGVFIQFYRKGNEHVGRIYCHVRTRHSQENFEVPYENLAITNRTRWNKAYSERLKRSWESSIKLQERLRELYDRKD